MPLLRHVFPCYVTPLRFKAVQNHCVPWHTSASWCIALASRHQPPHRPCVSVRGDSLLCHSIALRFISMPLPNNASPLVPSPLRFCARRLFTLHSFAIPCLTVLCLASATHCLTQPCRCFSGRIEATHFDTQPSRVTVSQYFVFAMRNVSRLLRCSTSSVSTFPLRCRDTHRPAKPLLFF